MCGVAIQGPPAQSSLGSGVPSRNGCPRWRRAHRSKSMPGGITPVPWMRQTPALHGWCRRYRRLVPLCGPTWPESSGQHTSSTGLCGPAPRRSLQHDPLVFAQRIIGGGGGLLARAERHQFPILHTISPATRSPGGTPTRVGVLERKEGKRLSEMRYEA